MINLIQYWNVHYKDRNNIEYKATFQTWENDVTKKREYWIFRPPDRIVEIVSKEEGNEYFKMLKEKYKMLKVIKLINEEGKNNNEKNNFNSSVNNNI
ncbi:MAG: hypothetical protein J6T10_22855 [Methanobrevibacter sp.]|nr:hypothetical protein [Methanobrevibacter sp.]